MKFNYIILLTSLILTTNLYPCFCQSNDDGSDEFDKQDYQISCYFCGINCFNYSNKDEQQKLIPNEENLNNQLKELKDDYEKILKSGNLKRLKENLEKLLALHYSAIEQGYIKLADEILNQYKIGKKSQNN